MGCKNPLRASVVGRGLAAFEGEECCSFGLQALQGKVYLFQSVSSRGMFAEL